MKKLTHYELILIIELHKLWLQGNNNGAKADLSRTDLSNINLENVNLSGAILRDAKLTNSKLTNVNLNYANLERCNLSHATLENTYLSLANLTNAAFNGANLTEVNFSFANLTKANLTEATLTNVKMSSCNLRGAITDKKYIQITCIGSRKDTITFCIEDNYVWCGCWNDYNGGSLKEFEKRVKRIYGKSFDTKEKQYFTEYKGMISYFKFLIKNNA